MVCWRGLIDGRDHPHLLARLQAEFPMLGSGTCMDIGHGSICLIYALAGGMINWLW